MKKNYIYLGLGIVGVGILAYYFLNNTGSKSTTTTASNQSNDISTKCPFEEVPCANNPSKCYNPNIPYFVSPCHSPSV